MKRDPSYIRLSNRIEELRYTVAKQQRLIDELYSQLAAIRAERQRQLK